jgi:RNA polymerase sigma-70 factor (ECF subfamily)
VTTAGCPACGGQVPDRDRSRGGRRARYCSGACKAKAYRDRQQAGGLAAPDGPPLPAAARHARAVEIRQQASDLIATLADTASGQQPLFTTPGTTRRPRPAEAARTLHRLITELATLATAAGATKRATKRRLPETSPLFGDAAPDGE